VARGVLGGELPFAVLEVGRFQQNPCAVGPGTLAVRTRIVHAHHHRVRDLAGPGRPAIITHVADDHRAVSEPELRAVVLADAHAFDEPERRRQPGDSLADVGVDQNRIDRGGWNGAVGFHTRRFNPATWTAEGGASAWGTVRPILRVNRVQFRRAGAAPLTRSIDLLCLRP